mgnify:CR=1 FL=1
MHFVCGKVAEYYFHPMNSDIIQLESYRADYPVLKEYTYLNTPATGIVHPKVQQAAQEASEKMTIHGSKYREEWMFETKAEVKEAVAKFINAPVEGIVLAQNFTIPMNMLAEMLYSEGKKVAYIQGDYPSLVMPFRVRGFEMHEYKLDGDGRIDYNALEDFLRQNRIDILAISHVQWGTGYVVSLTEVAQMCKLQGVFSVVDATQGAGVIPVDVKALDVDVLAASTYKWAGAGFGNGFMYVAQKVLEQYEPKTAGFNSFLWKDGQPYYEANIKCFEPGHHDHEAFIRLQTALERQMEMGQEAILEEVHKLVNYTREQLQLKGLGSIYTFEGREAGSILFVEGDQSTLNALEEKKVLAAARGKGIRIGLHYYNNFEDVDRFVEIYSELKR